MFRIIYAIQTSNNNMIYFIGSFSVIFEMKFMVILCESKYRSIKCRKAIVFFFLLLAKRICS